jgi:hypothetical protein
MTAKPNAAAGLIDAAIDGRINATGVSFRWRIDLVQWPTPQCEAWFGHENIRFYLRLLWFILSGRGVDFGPW